MRLECRCGAKRVVAARQIGQMQSSPTVIRKYAPTSQNGDTDVPSWAVCAATFITANAHAIATKPSNSFDSALSQRPRAAKRVHTTAKIGARAIPSTGLSDWNHVAG